MPTISKQVGGGNHKAATHRGVTGVLSRIAPIKPVSVDCQKWAIYGVPKSGKTRFACTFKKPLLLIGAEDGTASVAGIKGVEFVLAQSLAEVDELILEVRKGRWASVVLDTLSKLRDLRIVELFSGMGMEVPEKKPFLFADKIWKGVWTQCSKDLKDSLRVLLDYPRVMNLNTLVISQEANLVYDDGAALAGSDVLRPVIGSAVGKSLCDWLHAECDYLGQTLIREQTAERMVEIGGQKVSTRERTGRKEYCLRISPDGIYQAGFRLPEGRILDQEFLIDPTCEKVCDLIRGRK